MPGGDGINLIQIIKNRLSIPVILLTAMGDSINKIEGLKTGADDYVTKPFEPEELYLRINNLLDFFNKNSDQNSLVFFGNYLYDLSKYQIPNLLKLETSYQFFPLLIQQLLRFLLLSF